MRKGRRRGGHAPGAVNALTGIVILLVVATLALTASQTPPPAIAELAPSAVQQIKDAPSEQTSTAGEGEGGAGGAFGGSSTTTTTAGAPGGSGGAQITAAPPIERARVRRCVGDPPRQTEDPQSPPCVPYWEGDNGGATTKGVTRDTIKLALPYGNQRVADDLMAYFNKRYEFYGRKVVLVAGGGGETCEQRKSSAVFVDEQLKVFGALDASNGNAGPCFQAEMARRKLISSVHAPTFLEQDMARLSPYLWQYAASFDKILRGIGEMYCARLAGKSAERSPDPLIKAKPRKLGVIIQNVLRDTNLETGALDAALARCGARVARYERISSNDDVGLASPDRAQLAMVQFKNDDVTTIVNLGIAFVAQNISSAADSQAYYPEWIFSSYGGFDANLVIKAFWPQSSERQAIFGVTSGPLMRPWSKEPAFVAAKEVDPTIDPVADLGPLQEFVNQYRSLLVVASGIQMAGPRLTPETFGAALQRTSFPYPADDPTKSGDVSFQGDHSMTEEFAEFWWSEAAKSPVGNVSDGSVGAICYVDNGARRRLGRWPTGAGGFFEPPCDPNTNG